MHRIFVASARTKGDVELQNQKHLYWSTGRSHIMPGLCSRKTLQISNTNSHLQHCISCG